MAKASTIAVATSPMSGSTTQVHASTAHDAGQRNLPATHSDPAPAHHRENSTLERAARNHAPGILDRRKSFRPSPSVSLRGGRGNRRSLGIPIRISVADMASEMRLKQDEDDEEKADTFEDATSTPRPSSTEPDADAGAPNPNVEASDEKDAGKKATPKIAEEHAEEKHDDKKEQHISDTSATTQQDSTNATLAASGETSTPQAPQAQARQPSPAPSRDRSLSPRKQPKSRQESPVRVEQGLSGHGSLPSQPPPSTTERILNLEQLSSNERQTSPPPPQPGIARRASSGFGALLGRMGSIRKPAKSPPAPRSDVTSAGRRGTTASAASMEVNGLPTIHDGKQSLQDQFSNLRRQEEFGSAGAQGHSKQPSDDSTQTSPTADGVVSPTSSPPGDVKSPPLNPKLPPGTAAGVSAGPSEEPKEVNWDLWQQLVYEGPAAVSRTSGEEMRQAITAGIPPAIRGVVWQVLAESKCEDLEGMYRTLKARGTETEQRPVYSRANSSIGANGKSGVTSDASSEHSDHSTAAASGIMSPPTSVSADGQGHELHAKLLAEKQKREAAALQKLEKAIRRDMGARTSYSKFTQSAGLQDGLFGVCKAYALFDEGVGYAQGINFIAMPLLFNMTEEEAFTLLVRLMSKYDLRSMFTHDMPGLHLRLYQFERLLEEFEPAVYCHLKRKHVAPQLYATQWFLTLFAYRFPLQLVLRIYDLIFSEGLTAILKFGIVLMQRNRQALLDMKDMSSLTTFLKEKLFDVYIDKSPSAASLLDSGFFGSVSGGADKELYRADDMVRDACSIKVADETLKAYAVEWEESLRSERQRAAELENLKFSNTQLAARCKVLEERAQQHDTEHVTIAQDLVKLKVENDALQDANEALQIQVAELQKMIDLQPAEVEEKLKQEMDRIMQRNIEVQNENRHLKEEQDEMEHELVQTKLAHAQIQSDFEALKQKWQGLQNLMSDKQS